TPHGRRWAWITRGRRARTGAWTWAPNRVRAIPATPTSPPVTATRSEPGSKGRVATAARPFACPADAGGPRRSHLAANGPKLDCRRGGPSDAPVPSATRPAAEPARERLPDTPFAAGYRHHRSAHPRVRGPQPSLRGLRASRNAPPWPVAGGAVPARLGRAWQRRPCPDHCRPRPVPAPQCRYLPGPGGDATG